MKKTIIVVLIIFLIFTVSFTSLFFITKYNNPKTTTQNDSITNFKIFYQEVQDGPGYSSEIQINNNLTFSVITKNWGSCVGCHESTEKYNIDINQTELDSLNKYISEAKKYQNDYTGEINKEKAEDDMVTFYILDTVNNKIIYLKDMSDETLKTNLIHLIIPILNRKTN